MTVEEQILSELRKISRVTTLVNSRTLETELSKYANTPERRKIWVLIDGKRMPKQIAEDGKVSERAVNYFVAALRAADLIKYERGSPPRRLLDYVPASWMETAVGSQEQEAKPLESPNLSLLASDDSSKAGAITGGQHNG